MRVSSLQIDSWIREEREGNLFVRAWRAEERAWKPLWLLVVPAVLVALGAAAVRGGFVVPLRGALLPLAAAAMLGIAMIVGLVGAVLLWRCAFIVGSRLLGFAARAAALIAVAILVIAAYTVATGTLWPAGPVPKSTTEQPRLTATQRTTPGDAIAAFPPAGR